MSDKQFEVGDRVQHEEEDGSIDLGTITSITPATKEWESGFYNWSKEDQAATITYAVVKWDSDNEIEQYNIDGLQAEDTELERQFRTTVRSVQEKIDEELQEAQDAIYRATKLAEEHGIPFSAGVSPLGNTYYPDSFSEKYGDLDREFVQGITDTYNEYGNSGWKHSAVC